MVEQLSGMIHEILETSRLNLTAEPPKQVDVSELLAKLCEPYRCLQLPVHLLSCDGTGAVQLQIIIQNTSGPREADDFWSRAELNLLMALIHYIVNLKDG